MKWYHLWVNLCMLDFHFIIQVYNYHSSHKHGYLNKNLCYASKHMKCTFKCIIQVHELAPSTCVLKILIDLFPSSPLITYTFISLPLYLYFFSLYLYTLFSPPLSSMTTKVYKVDMLGLSMSINGVRIIFSNLVQT